MTTLLLLKCFPHEAAVDGGPHPHHDPAHSDICSWEVPQENQNLRMSHYFSIWAYRLRLGLNLGTMIRNTIMVNVLDAILIKLHSSKYVF